MPHYLQTPCQFREMAELLAHPAGARNFPQDECHVLGKFTKYLAVPAG